LEKTENEVESILDATYQKTVGELENVEV